MDEYSTGNVEAAVAEYLTRQSRLHNPKGKFDKARRWYPSEEEEQPCCKEIRSPSRARPYSLMLHCRTMKHVASLYGVGYKELTEALKGVR